MNLILKKEIIYHIFKALGLYGNNSGIVESLRSNKFSIDKKIVFENNGIIQQKDIWAAEASIDASKLKMMISDISDDIAEFAIIVQMDNYNPCGIRISEDEDDSGSFCFKYEDRWFDAGTLIQAKLLVGIESLVELMPNWSKISNHKDLYDNLVSFLNHCEQENDER